MPRLVSPAMIALAVVGAVVGCASGPGADAPSPWAEVMDAVDHQFDIVRHEVDDSTAGNLPRAAAAARAAAALVRQGYGALERRDVPDFARMARDCESWLMAVALEAELGRGALAREALHSANHCKRCHDAADRR